MKTYSISTPRRAGLWLACLTSFALFVPAASAAVSLTPTENEPKCVVMSGSWSSGTIPYSGDDSDSLDDYFVLLRGFVVKDVFDNDLDVVFLDFEFDGELFDRYVFRSNATSDSEYFDGPLGLFVVSSVFNPVDDTWSGTYKITDMNCEPTHGVPEGGSALALFACGLGAVGAGRRFMNKRRA